MTKLEALNQYFGHTAFRPAQETLIDAIISGRDVLGVMPTGAGKSVCYQIPAMLLYGVTLVVSPLIALMKDQVAQLKQAGIPGAYINSSLTASQYKEVLRRAGDGRYKIIYVAPERLETEDFISFAMKANIALIAVDEAHCVSQWGQDFRPSYLNIAGFIDQMQKRPIVGAFTATATAEVKRDMVRLLGLRDPLGLTTGFDRPNLFFQVDRPKYKPAHFRELIMRCCGFAGEAGGRIEHASGRSESDRYGIIYCATRKTVDTLYAELRHQGIAAARYHAGLPDDERRQSQDDFIGGNAAVMVATNAFGMGIDKPNVRFVIHYNMPKNLESYYQEAGRAGRDGKPSDCILMFSDDDIKIAEFFIQNSEKNKELTERERRLLYRKDVERLDKMTGYCEFGGCLRAYLLRYFGEKHAGRCGNCGNCKKSSRSGVWRNFFGIFRSG